MFNINKLATEIVAFKYELGIRRTLRQTLQPRVAQAFQPVQKGVRQRQ
jgi:hypothetical protein